ncbi:MAG: histidine phosphatase family protein [Lachnospiraceae bacterium]|nr:histidine phosphatase family protein [Lachnospiraceae bacterium]
MLYVMRHGKTDWNMQTRLQGRTDIPLNTIGRDMAIAAREKYRDVHFDVCYRSPLCRAKETAELFLEDREIEIIPDDRLTEISFGIYEGCAIPELPKDTPITTFLKDPGNYRGAEGGETLEELFARTGSFLKEVVEPRLAKGEDVLIVGHGAMNSAIICQVRQLTADHLWDLGIENCKLMALTYPGN